MKPTLQMDDWTLREAGWWIKAGVGDLRMEASRWWFIAPDGARQGPFPTATRGAYAANHPNANAIRPGDTL
jgi:hypothetical protein